MLIAIAALALFLALLLIAAANDIASMTIPNWVSIALAACFPIFAYALDFSAWAMAWHFGFGVVILALGIAMFSAGLLGGGDVKVLAAAAVWTGVEGFVTFLSATLLAGGVLAVLLILARRYAEPHDDRPEFLNRLLDRNSGAPYAVAIAVGGLAALPALPFALSVWGMGVSLTPP
jgi:prepilin peptidase CpaA